jgi:lysophospholipase L1-like esterase
LAAFVLLAVSSAVALGLCELCVRVVSPQQDIPEWFRPDEKYGFSLKPNFSQDYRYAGYGFVEHISTNSLGFRDREHVLPVTPGKRNLLLLGDSFVFGYGINVEDRLDSHLEALLKPEAPPWTIFNAGVPGWGTANETAWARANMVLLKPDIVALVFCANDPSDDAGKNPPVLPKKDWIQGKTFLRRHFHLYRLLMRQITLRKSNRTLQEQQGTGAGHLDTQAAVIVSEQEWMKTLPLIREFHRDLTAYNPKALLLVLATAPENDDTRKHLASLDNGQNLLYVDLWPSAATLAPEDRRLPHDGHWSPAMHEIAAQQIYGAIKKHEGEERLSGARGK